MPAFAAILVVVFLLIAVAAVVYAVRGADVRRRQVAESAETLRATQAGVEAEHKAAALELKEEALKIRTALDEELRTRRTEIGQQERRLQQKEEQVDRRLEEISRRQVTVEEKEEQLVRAREALEATQAELAQATEEQRRALERIAALPREEARRELLAGLERELVSEKADRIRRADAELREEVDERSRELIITTIQRHAADQTGETSVSVVPLPSD
ncbi:MAG TPA: Rnase Y domain-containing protein, partial [Candidatus Dormibacteraeota bacterium]|nr:Rnase Y domain-containing protein [Candidatus Dormibacteraeota bacterium]